MLTVEGNALPSVAIVEEALSPEELAAMVDRGIRFERNWDCYERLAPMIGRKYQSYFICIANGELSSGENPTELVAKAIAKHPDERGAIFLKYITPRRGDPNDAD